MGIQKLEHIFIVAAIVAVLMSENLLARRIWEVILNDFRLHSFGRVLVSRNLTDLLDIDNITVYLPSSDAFFKYDTELNEATRWTTLLTYATQHGRFTLANLPKEGKIKSRLGADRYLYVNTFYIGGRQVTTINGAAIIYADIITDNGVIHILDSIIYPIGSGLTIAQYIEKPEDAAFTFSAIVMADIVAQSLKRKTNNTHALITSFSPNDSYLVDMAEYGKTPLFENITLLKEVYEAHIIENEALFLPYEIAEIPPKRAMFGSLRFYRRGGYLYVVNNRVHARVVKPNIPTTNGVIHVIDNLLRYVYHNAVQITNDDNINSTRMFNKCIKALAEDQLSRLASATLTMFIPSDFAFSKSPLFWQRPQYAPGHYTNFVVTVAGFVSEIRTTTACERNFYRSIPNHTGKKTETVDRRVYLPMLLHKDPPDLGFVCLGIVAQHVTFGQVLDAASLYDGRKVMITKEQVLTVVHSDGDIYLETADKKIRSRISVTDSGVTNGVVHLLDNLLTINFTIWEAISDIPALRRVYDVVSKDIGDLRHMFNVDTDVLTVFLPSNLVFDEHRDIIQSMIQDDPEGFLEVLKGHIVMGHYSTSLIKGEIQLYTLSDKTITVSRRDRSTVITVVGGHVTSTVHLQDIYCNNGVIHIIDKLLHTPTQTIAKDVAFRNEVAYSNVLINVMNDESYDLDSVNENYTFFVPNNVSFSYLPWQTHEKLFNRNYSEKVMRAHVVKGETRTLDEMSTGSALPAINNVIYVLKKDKKVFVTSNNVMAEVVKANIPAVNGWIHVIDRVLTVPYQSVSHILSSKEEVSLFHHMLSTLPEYKDLVTSSPRNVTLFVPSSRYINTLTSEQLARVKYNQDILRKLFYGHVLPDVRLDDVFLRQYPHEDYCSRSSNNVTFKISRRQNTLYVGAGFDILPLDVVGRAFGCTDGIVYVIDGFLNYSPFTVLERLKREPGLSASFDRMEQLVSPHDVNLLGNVNMSFTFMMPDDYALDYFSSSELQLFKRLPDVEKQRTFWRHSINGCTLYYEDLKNGHMTPDVLPQEVAVDVQNEAVYLRYRTVQSKVKQWNLIASNGVIHILKKFLYDVTQPGDKTTPTAEHPDDPLNRVERWEQTGMASRISVSRLIIVQFTVLLVVAGRYAVFINDS